MKNKAIIFDLDGTAVDSPLKKLPTQELIEVVSQLKNNYHLCAATGRVWSYAQPVLRELNLIDPSIIAAGTQICDSKTGKIIWQKIIENQALDQVIKVFKQYPEYKLLSNDYIEDDYFNGGVNPSDFKISEPIYFLEQVFIPNSIADEIKQRLSLIKEIACVMVTAQKPRCRDLHITNSTATKEHAIAELLHILGIEKKDTIGVGDGHNDLHLFHGVGYKVAMGNAVSELKNNADEVIGDVKDDGLTDYLGKLLRVGS